MSDKKALPEDSDLAGVEKALKRAAKAARTLARKTRTPCYVIEEGKIVNIAERRAVYRPSKRKSANRNVKG
jgi:diaminopimelate decarboxylase